MSCRFLADLTGGGEGEEARGGSRVHTSAWHLAQKPVNILGEDRKFPVGDLVTTMTLSELMSIWGYH